MLLLAGATVALATGLPAQDSARSKEKKSKEMPSAETIAKRHKEADAQPLFASSAPLTFTLIANYKAISKDRDTLSTKRFAGRLVIANAAGTPETLAVAVRTRGHYRLAKCYFVPLRLEFPKKETKGTVFEDQRSLKLGTHCDASSEQIVLREYLAYQIHELVSPFYFQTRLARVTYVDSASGKTVDTKYGMFVENEDQMAARADGVLRELRRATFDDVEAAPLMNMSLFEYMIGNTDWSMYALHNVRMVQRPDGELIPVPYDFDFSGLVGARYATPDPKLPIRNVKERLFRGPCKTVDEWAPIVAPFQAAKSKVLALSDSIPSLEKGYAGDARRYLEDFYRTLDRASDFKGDIIDNCNRKGAS